MDRRAADTQLFADWLTTPIGPMLFLTDETRLHLLEFPERNVLEKELRQIDKRMNGRIAFGATEVGAQLKTELTAYFSGTLAEFTLPLAYHATAFTQDVWNGLRALPLGTRLSYSTFAKQIGKPAATRAVARANGANPFAILVPCHRLVGANGALTGYGGGLWRKDWLLRHEHSVVENGGP